MANTRTLLELRTAVQARGSYENSTDITTALLNDFINEGIAEVYDIMVGKWTDYYTVLGTNISVVAGTASYAVATNFYKLRKVEMQTTTGEFRRLLPHDLDVAHQYTTPVSGKAYRYRLQAGNIVLVPTPAAAEVMRLYYIPFATRLVIDADTFDGINNYEELVVQLALKRCKVREELPTDDIEREIARLTMRIEKAADGRDAEPFFLDPQGPPYGDGDWDGWD